MDGQDIEMRNASAARWLNVWRSIVTKKRNEAGVRAAKQDMLVIKLHQVMAYRVKFVNFMAKKIKEGIRQDKEQFLATIADETTEAKSEGQLRRFSQLIKTFAKAGRKRSKWTGVLPMVRLSDGMLARSAEEGAEEWRRRFQELEADEKKELIQLKRDIIDRQMKLIHKKKSTNIHNVVTITELDACSRKASLG